MTISRNGTRPSRTPPADWFTGQVRMDPIAEAPEPARLRAVLVTFEPAARTNWHTHPLGQTLYVTAGSGRVQIEGDPVQEVGPGDVIWFPPNVRHWHGAAPDVAMTHIAMQEAQDGKTTDWQEPVTDDQYGG